MPHSSMGLKVLTVAGLLAAAPAAGQTSGQTSGQESGNWFTNILRYGGTTVPPAAPRPVDDVYCPSVGVIEGGAAMQAFTGGKTGDPSALRHQISLGQIARECQGRDDGSIVVKVGVEGRALIGPAGSSGGRFESPVTFVIKRGDRVLATRTQRVAVAVRAGEMQGSFVAIQDGLVVPPGINDFEIDVGLVSGGKGGPAKPAPRKPKAAQAAGAASTQ